MPGYHPPKAFNHDGLHRYLWRRTDENGLLAFSNVQLGKIFGVSTRTAEEHVSAMSAAGRLRRKGRNPQHIYIYEITDPALWKPEEPETHAQKRRVRAWG